MKPIQVKLDCDHVRYFKGWIPPLGERIWCFECEQYEVVGPAEAAKAETIQEDFVSKPVGRGRYTGECLYQSNNKAVICGHTETNILGWHQLRERMNKHYLRSHTSFGTTIFTDSETPPPGKQNQPARRLPPNSPAPF